MFQDDDDYGNEIHWNIEKIKILNIYLNFLF